VVLTAKATVERRPLGAEEEPGQGEKEVEGSWNLASAGGKAGIPAGDKKGEEGLLEPVPARGGWE